ncbi:ABC transporter permease [Actinomyces slackii]|uniref:Macrolide export ATP-binding/permease protein MacB n=1 Tax=Actinomyces slackii TaxID=52774 RepID=A0A3S5EM52_9ACTO|nr:FtsX-like permease family protein [Actinomyces slackii]VEG74279.1 Macrolide export ATP-binding/permease protein MacB [Actinomyces slackii]
MLKVALRSIRAHFKQFLLTTIAVVLGIAFLSGTLALRAVLSDTFSSLLSSTVTSDLYVTGKPIEGTEDTTAVITERIDSSLADEAKQVEGVTTAHAGASVMGVLVGADDTPVTTSGAPTLIISLDDEETDMTWVAGKRPKGGSEIALESGAMERSGLKVGDTTHVVVQGQPTEVTVVGEFNYGTSMAGATVIHMDADWLMPLAAPDGKVTSISVNVEDGADVEAVKDRLAQAMPDSTRVMTKAEMIKENNKPIEQVLGFVQTFLLVFVVVAMFVGSFIIMNSFAMSVRQRVREFALLRAVGASPSSVFGTVFLQALVIGIIGSALGLVVGAGLLQGIVALLEAAGMPLDSGVPMTPTIIVTSMVMGVLVTVVGALLPARDAAMTHPVEAMRDAGGAREKSLVLRTVLGGLLLAAGIAGVAAAWVNEGIDQRRLILGLGAAGVILGLLVLSPVLARPIVSLIGLPLRLIRPSGRLAVRNIVHNPRRTANTSGALMVGMALVCAGGTLAASMQTSTADAINTSLKADFVIQPVQSTGTAVMPAEMADEIEQIDGVATAERFTGHMVAATMPDGTQAPTTNTIVMNAAAFNKAMDLKVVEGSLEDVDATHVAVREDVDATMGDTVTLTGPLGTVQATVVAVVDPDAIRADFYTSPELAAGVGSWTRTTPTEADQVLDTPLGMLLTLEEGADAGAVRDKAEEILAPTYQYSVSNAEELSDMVGQQVNRTLAIVYGLLGLSIVIAVLGIVNTLVLSVSERTREIGLMRAVGLGKSQLGGSIVIESVLTAVYGTVLGGAAGVALAAALRKVLEDNGLTTLSIPWGQLVAMLVLSVVVGVMAALWPALRASRMPVLDAIATE